MGVLKEIIITGSDGCGLSRKLSPNLPGHILIGYAYLPQPWLSDILLPAIAVRARAFLGSNKST